MTLRLACTLALGASITLLAGLLAVASPAQAADPLFSATPTTIDFGTVVAGDASDSQSVTITNISAATVSTIGFTTTDSGAFSWSGSACADTLAPGASCTFGLLFLPTDNSSASGTPSLSIGGETITISATGQGTPWWYWSAPVDFGDVAIGDSATGSFTIVNVSLQPQNVNAVANSIGAPFTVVSNGCSAGIEASANCAIEIAFTPVAIGELNDDFSVTWAGGGLGADTLHGTGIAPFELSSYYGSFGDVPLRENASIFAKIQNVSQTAQALPLVTTVTGTEFYKSADSCEGIGIIQPGEFCEVGVGFFPTVRGTASGTVHIVGPNFDELLGFTGKGVPWYSVDSIGFGEVVVDEWGYSVVTLTNIGTQSHNPNLVIDQPVGFFGVGENHCANVWLEPGESCTVDYGFRPTVAGTSTDVSYLFGTGIDTLINLKGVGIDWFEFDTTDRNFGRVAIGASRELEVTVTNRSASTRDGITAYAPNSPFSLQDNGCATPIPAGASCTLRYQFAPLESGSKSSFGELEMNGKAANIYLGGIGVAYSKPTGTLTGSLPQVEGLTASVEFTGVSDDDGSYAEPFSYEFDFGNDGTVDAASASPSADVPDSFTPDGPTTFEVAGWIVDATGARSNQYTAQIEVRNAPPSAWIAAPETAIAGVPVTIEVGADDPGPVDAAGQFTYVIDWGDGILDTITGPADPAATHTYGQAGDFEISVTATDRDGGTSSFAAPHAITVAPATVGPNGTSGTSGSLAHTGSDAGPLGLLALLALLLAAVGVRMARRETRSAR
jgi:hypothetical protein